MTRQIVFQVVLILTIGVFAFSINRLAQFFRFTGPAFPIKDFGKRIAITLSVAFAQTKILRRFSPGLLHAFVFWGFCIILIGSTEIVIDGVLGTEKVFKMLGPSYYVLTAAGDILALFVGVSVVILFIRRLFLNIKRFNGIEMNRLSHADANISLLLILLLMLSLIAMNMGYAGFKPSSGFESRGVYPVGTFLSGMAHDLTPADFRMIYEVSLWIHILLIFLFANYLPYSKHFHVFLSVPNVFLSSLDPPGKMQNIASVTREVRLIMCPGPTSETDKSVPAPERFGVRDAEDASWKSYLDALSCTQCGRCTSVCPANITGKRLSPRKVMMDLRARMNEKGPFLVKNGRDFDDNSSLIRNFISEEEIWACTTCNACATECPVNINQPGLILELRRYLVMEEASAPGGLKMVFSNIENNGAPWQYSSDDRLLWTKDLEINIR